MVRIVKLTTPQIIIRRMSISVYIAALKDYNMNKLQKNQYLELSIRRQYLYEEFITIHEDRSFYPGMYWNARANEINVQIKKHNMEVKQEFPKNAELLANFVLLGF